MEVGYAFPDTLHSLGTETLIQGQPQLIRSVALNEFNHRPNPPLHSDPACIVFRSLSTSCYLGFAQRLGAGGAGELHSLGVMRQPQFIIPILILSSLCATGAGFFLGFKYWWVFLLLPLILAAMFLTGLLATFEDDLPGGFNNPDGSQTPDYVAKVSSVGCGITIGVLVVSFALIAIAFIYFFYSNH